MSSIRISVAASLAIAVSLSVSQAHAVVQSPPSPLAGVWALNSELSDMPSAPPEGGDHSGQGGQGGRGYGGRGGGGRGGGGGGMRGGGFGQGGGGMSGGRGNREDMQRTREAIRDILDAPARMTVTVTDAMVIVTTGEGKTTRLSTDGTKIKDESTGIERKTRWEGGKLVSDISGAGPGKLTQTYAIDPDSPHLILTVQREGDKTRPPMKHVYDREQ